MIAGLVYAINRLVDAFGGTAVAVGLFVIVSALIAWLVIRSRQGARRR